MIMTYVIIITTTSAIFKVEDEVEIMGKVTESVLEGHCDVKHPAGGLISLHTGMMIAFKLKVD